MNRYDCFARKTYLDLVCCSEEHSWQQPECDMAKGYDLLWLIVPVVGVLLFTATIENRYEAQRRRM